MLEPGTRLGGRYRLDERFGAGGMGEWRATDVVLGRIVAVRVVLAGPPGDPDFPRRFLAEARVIARISHPRLVAIHDYGSDGETVFLVMEYVPGEPLMRVLHRRGRLDAGSTMSLVEQAADALQAVHDRGLVHRDIQPGNLLLRPDWSLMLTGFGMVTSAAGPFLAALGGTSYLAPEQVAGRVIATPMSDEYALGLVAYECLAGRRPFEGDNPLDVAMQKVRKQPAALDADAPPAARAVVERALATDPADRWPSAAAMADAARQARAG